jgi:hypothetical protein
VDLAGTTKILRINLWEKRPEIDYYEQVSEFTTKPNMDIVPFSYQQTITIKKILTYDFYNNLIYRKDMKCFNFLKLMMNDGDIIKKGEVILIDTYDQKEEEEAKLKDKYGNVYNDLTEIKEIKIDDNVKQNRFFQRINIPNILCAESTKWIVNECNAKPMAWNTKDDTKFNTFHISNENNGHIFNFLLNMSGMLLKKIQSTYDMPINTLFNITEMYILKQDQTMDYAAIMKRSTNMFNIIIGLNDMSEYDGGDVLFDDGIQTRIGNGQIIVYSRAYKPCFLKVNMGTKFVLMISVDC